MDVASDDYDNIIDERQDNTLQSSIELVKNVNTCSQDTHVQIQMNTSAVRANNEPLTTRDTLIRLKQHKWSLLAFICGVSLTLGIVVPVMMSKSSSPEKGIIIIFSIYLTCFFSLFKTYIYLYSDKLKRLTQIKLISKVELIVMCDFKILLQILLLLRHDQQYHGHL